MLILSLAMNFLASENQPLHSSSSPDEDLIKQILLTHNPDGRHLDSELLLRAMENIMSYAKSEVSDAHDGAIAKSGICNVEVVGSEETLGHTIYKVSHGILFNYSMGGNPHAKTMVLFDMLGHYKWDAKAVLVLSAFATSYGEFWLIMQLYPCNPLAASIALLKQLPKDLCLLKHLFKVLNVLMKTIVDLTKCIIEFEELPVNHVILDCEAIGTTNSQIYMATYWIIRSALICSSQIKDLRAMKNVQVHTKMHNKLLDLSKESHIDNQEVLEMLFSLKDSLPLKDSSSQAKLAVSELKSKVVILLVSRPELLSIEVLLLLVQQMFDHPHRVNLQGSYEIVWVPIPLSDTWTDVAEQNFDFLSNSLPWFSIRRPWLLSSIVVKSIKQAWDFKEKPLMVVLDTQGMVTNLNAIDMALIWGAMAFPFSTSRENELWEEETWNLQLLLDGIDPLVAKWVEEDQNLCIYGSNNIDWIREFNAKMRNMTSAGLQLKMVYVGKKNSSDDHMKNILATMYEEKLTSSLTCTKIYFFWLRLESMRRSKLRLGHTDDHKDEILKQLSELLDTNDESEKGWVLLGKGSSTETLKLQGRKIMECLDLFPVWGENVAMLGLVGAITIAIEPPLLVEPCNHSNIIQFVEGLKDTIICDKCKRLLEKFVVYKCDGTG
ncbi:Protein SIEVE ELEMENT OCCLUSION C [Camellia lanceoleosa]|nr:Protein SIEVE ELEMENT OCCLUSION C [Camellia lanceoleosa]